MSPKEGSRPGLRSLPGLFPLFAEELWARWLAQAGDGELDVIGDLDKVLWGGPKTWDRVLNFVGDDHDHLVHAAWGLRGQRWGRCGGDDGGDRSALSAEALVCLLAEEMGLCQSTSLCGCRGSSGLVVLWGRDELGFLREIVREDKSLGSGDAALEDAHALGLAGSDGVPFDSPCRGGPDGFVGGCGAAGAEDEFYGVDGEEKGGDPRDYCEKDGFAAGTVNRASKRGGGCGKSNGSHCLEADDE